MVEKTEIRTIPVLRAIRDINRGLGEAAEIPAIRRRLPMRPSEIDAAIEASLLRGLLVHDDDLTGYWLTEAGHDSLPRDPDRRVGFRGVPA